MTEGKRGKLIVIDGTDGSGKETQSKLLLSRLEKEGFQTALFDFPQYGKKSAALVEAYLNGEFGTAEQVGPYRGSIFYACDGFGASSRINKAIEEGRIVIANRYVSSNQGHQAGKINNIAERDKFLDWLDNLEFNIFGIPHPDLTLLLYMPPSVGQQLVERKGQREYLGTKKRDMHEEDLEHLKKASEAYLYVVDKFNWPIISCAPDGTIDSLRTIEDIAEEVYGYVKRILI